MKILLINTNRNHNPLPLIPIGLCYVATSLNNAGHDVNFLDLCFSKNCEEDIQNSIGAFKPKMIGISIRNIDDCKGFNSRFYIEDINNEIIKPCKKLFTGTIVIGGSAVGVSGADILAYCDLEYAIVGEGEAAMAEFAGRIEKGLPLHGLGGLVIRRNGMIVEENPASCIDDINDLPLVEINRFLNLKPYAMTGSPLQIQTKRGCALKCSYCTYNKIEGYSYRLKSPGRIADEIEYLIKETGIKNFEFADSTFNIPAQHTKSIMREILKRKLKVKLNTLGLNPIGIDHELVDLMKKAGFYTVDVGVDSCNDQILKNLQRNFSKADIVRSAKLLQEKKLPVRWFLLFGAPGETRETVYDTINTINGIASKWDIILPNVGLRIYKNTPLMETAQKEDIGLANETFLKPTNYAPLFISLDEIREIVDKQAKDNPNYYIDDASASMSINIILSSIINLFRLRLPTFVFYIFLRKMGNIIPKKAA